MIKIAYIIEGLYNSGGMERVISQKANWLATHENIFDITIITFSQNNTQKDFFVLHKNVKRILLQSGSNYNVLNSLRKDLTDCLNEHKFDICISTYGREFKLLPDIKDKSKKIVEFHFSYDINKHWMANSCPEWKTLIIGSLKTWIMRIQAKKYDKIVCLTQSDEKKWHSDKVVQIYNPITIGAEKLSNCSSKTVVAIGRMDRQKGFDMLLNCWKLIEDKHLDWQLRIYGGGDVKSYKKQIIDLRLKTVVMAGTTNDIQSVLLNSSIYVLSSRYEGFPLTICEAMACGLPIVSFDCPSGPSELVVDGQNGYLIRNVGDIYTMADKLSVLMESEDLRCKMGVESKRLSLQYSLDNIMEQWVELFRKVLSN